MSKRLLEFLANTITRYRVAVLAVLVLIVGVLASQIPYLDSDPSPRNLRAAYGGQDRIEANLKRTFGDTDRVILVLVEAPNVLAPQAAGYIHVLSQALAKLPHVQRVDSITSTPLPHAAKQAPPDRQENDTELDDLEAAIAGGNASDETSDLEAAIAGDIALDAPPSDDGARTAKLGERILPIVQGDSEHFPQGLRSLAERAEKQGLRGGPVVRGSTITPAELDALTDAVQRSPIIQGRLISADRTVAVVAVSLDSSLVRHEEVAAIVGQVDTTLAEHPPPPNVTTRTGGLPHLRQEIVHKMRHDQRVIMPLALVVCVLLLSLAFRWVPGVLLPIGAVTMTAAMLLGVMALAGAQLNIINNILPTMLIITGISDSIHLIARYRFDYQRTRDQVGAGRSTVRALGVACFLTSLTTAVGFSSLAVASTPMLRQFGLLAAGGVLLAYVVTITFLPAALLVVPAPGAREEKETSGSVERFIVVLTRSIIKRPWPVVGVASALLAVCVGAATWVDMDMRLLDMFDKSDPVYQTTHTLETKLQGMRPLEIVLSSPTEGRFTDPDIIVALDEVKEWAREQDGVLGGFSYSDVAQEVSVLATGDPQMRNRKFRSRDHVEALLTVADAERDDDGNIVGLGHSDDPTRSAVRRYLTPDRRNARMTLMLGDVGAKRSMELIQGVDAHLADKLKTYDDVHYDLTGEAYLGSFGINAIVMDLFYGLLMAAVVIFVILALLFRSVVLGLASIPPNVIPLAGTMAYMVCRGFNLTPATVIIFAISIGLAVSGSIHVIARFREELGRGLGSGFALVRAARSTGKAIVFTSFTLSLGFAVLLLSSFVTIRQFGELIAVTIASCLGATVIVQPALLRLVAPFVKRASQPR